MKKDIATKEKKITMLQGELKSKRKELKNLGYATVKDAEAQLVICEEQISNIEKEFKKVCNQIEDLLE